MVELAVLYDLGGGKHRRAVQPLAMPFNPRRAAWPWPSSAISVTGESTSGAVSHRARQAGRILRRKITNAAPSR